jgi:hypothetical protein
MTKKKYTLYLPVPLARKLDQVARDRHGGKSALVEDAVRASLEPQPHAGIEDALARRLNEISRTLATLARDQLVATETLALFVRYFLTATPPVPDSEQESARLTGRKRYGAIARSDRPVTFLIGAGASLSSGAPSTAQVTKAFEDATKGRLNPRELRTLLHSLPEQDKQDILAPLFGNVVPHIGYRCLAALGRHRRVHVLNLNWDRALTDACDDLDVRHVVFDLCNPRARRLLNGFDDGPGVVIAHVHGKVGEQCRFEALRTLKFGEAETRFLKKHFLSNTLVIAGASVVRDTDLHALFLAKRESAIAHGNAQASQWYLGRPDDVEHLDAIRRSQLPHGVLNYFSAEDADFDELMLRVLSVVLNADWDRVREYQPSLALPSLDQIVWPKSTLLTPLLSQRTVALLGQARLGKSVAAHLLGYLRALWEAQEPWSQRDLPIRTVDGPADAVAALSSVIPGERRAYVIDNPFGWGAQTEDNLPFIETLMRLDEMDNRRSVVVIASRLSAWPDPGRHPLFDKGVVKSATAPLEWFSSKALRAYVRRVAPGRQDVADQIGPQRIRTPARLIDAIRGVPFDHSDLPDEEAETADKVALIEANSSLAWLCCVLRLQEFCAEMLPLLNVEAWIGGELSMLPLHKVVSRQFEFEGAERLRLGHDTDRQATDIYISAHESDVLKRLDSRSDDGRQLRDAFTAWKLIAAGSAGNWVPAQNATRVTLRQCAPDLLRVANGSALPLSLLSTLDYDAWDIKDLSYELVRLWNKLGLFAPGRGLLNRILADRGAWGTYAILEACLYMQTSASDELWHKVYSSLDDLFAEGSNDKEISLAVDALTWRPPPTRYQRPAWARNFFRSIRPSEGRWALVRFLAGYHGGGISQLDMDKLVSADLTQSWTDVQAEFAAWLVRWHFIHQSRARAQFARQPWVDKDFLCRTLHPQPRETTHLSMNRLLQSFLHHPEQAGWGFFLGCNFAAVGHGIDDEGRRLTKEALRAALPRSVGVIAAALTYGTANEYATELRRYFEQDENRDALLDGMRDGLLVDRVYLRPPRFIVNRDPVACYADVGLSWGNLKEALAGEDVLTSEGRFDLSTLVVKLRATLSHISTEHKSDAQEVIRRAELGDLRILDAAAATRRGAGKRTVGLATSNRYAQLLKQAAGLVETENSIPL